jgi:hypothetical protein
VSFLLRLWQSTGRRLEAWLFWRKRRRCGIAMLAGVDAPAPPGLGKGIRGEPGNQHRCPYYIEKVSPSHPTSPHDPECH